MRSGNTLPEVIREGVPVIKEVRSMFLPRIILGATDDIRGRDLGNKQST